MEVVKLKKLLIYLLGVIVICFILPVILTTKKINVVENVETTSVPIDTNKSNIYIYNKYATIKLLHTNTGEVEELPIDEYLYGVVSAEMPVDYEIEALKAQAIVARTYTIYQINNSGGKHEEADMCDNATCCQAWISKEDRMNRWEEDVREENWNKIELAVNETAGKIIVYNGEPIDAFFHSNSGGKTEIPVNVWGGTDYPYLQSVETSGEEGYEQYNSTVTISKSDLMNKLKEKYQNVEINFEELEPIKIIDRTEGERVKTIKIGNIEMAGTEARSFFGLKSTNFDISVDTDNVTFTVIGYGHGVGLSQTGSDSMAKNGSSCEEIIKHFYTDVNIVDVNSI